MNKEKKYQQGITKTKYFIDKYNWQGINYPSGKKELEKNMRKILLRLLSMFLY